MYQYWFFNYNKGTMLVKNVNNRENSVFVLSLNFSINLKLL